MTKLYNVMLFSSSCLFCVNANCPAACVCFKDRVLTNVEMLVSCFHTLGEIPRGFHIDSDVTTLVLTLNDIGVLGHRGINIANFTHLKTLVIVDCNVTIVHENSLQGFNSLEASDLSRNNITRLPNGMIQMTKKLTGLVLSYNRALVLPEHGFQIAELERLSIDHCALQSIPLDFFETMPNLQQVRMEGNLVKKLDPCQYQVFRGMQFVNRESNKLTVFPREVTQLLNESTVVIALNGNPFVCDCAINDGVEFYVMSHTLVDKGICYTCSALELVCQIPGAENISISDLLSVGVRAFSDTLECTSTVKSLNELHKDDANDYRNLL